MIIRAARRERLRVYTEPLRCQTERRVERELVVVGDVHHRRHPRLVAACWPRGPGIGAALRAALVASMAPAHFQRAMNSASGRVVPSVVAMAFPLAMLHKRRTVVGL